MGSAAFHKPRIIAFLSLTSVFMYKQFLMIPVVHMCEHMHLSHNFKQSVTLIYTIYPQDLFIAYLAMYMLQLCCIYCIFWQGRTNFRVLPKVDKMKCACHAKTRLNIITQ